MNKRRSRRAYRLIPEKPKTDLYTFYEQSVMTPKQDLDLMSHAFKRLTGRVARMFREDFCQTALLACQWAIRHEANRAWGVDLNPKPLRWARLYNFAEINQAAARVYLQCEDVLKVKTPPMDIICALNCSHFVFKTRDLMLRYFKAVARGLKKDGVFFLDVFGGPDAQTQVQEVTVRKGVTYIWDPEHFNPITHDFRGFIHFRLPSGKTLKKVFSYHWRLWTLPEIKDLLEEAGFSKVHVYWEDDDLAEDGDPVFRSRKEGLNYPSWIAYLAAMK